LVKTIGCRILYTLFNTGVQVEIKILNLTKTPTGLRFKFLSLCKISKMHLIQPDYKIHWRVVIFYNYIMVLNQQEQNHS
jgi:hypothetical protein